MKFIIHRASEPWGGCPCEEARYNEAINDWEIELNTFDELIELCRRYGKIIVDTGWNESCNYIEIYDYWRK